MNVEEMYQQIILDHYREKHHSGLRENYDAEVTQVNPCLLYTSPSPRDLSTSRMPSSA